MLEKSKQIGAATASPSKEFFVRTLTRDIELQDALLDLLDNCLDGIVRMGTSDLDISAPYKNFIVKITLSRDHFIIEDNCGGIPLKIAKDYAFSIGARETEIVSEKSATIGMYGIGMKRAIFKLGTEALVSSHFDTGFVVEISNEWMQNDEWSKLPIYELEDSKLLRNGTRIEVLTLNDEVAKSFENTSWIEEFRKTVSRHYALIIAKGLSVVIGSPSEILANIDPVKPEKFALLQASESTSGAARIAPFIYAGKLGEVDVKIFAGLYRRLLSEDEAADEEQTQGTSDDAGWIVACNDRVVIWKDKSRLTGWGEATVPNYHGQFIAITGLVLLHCNDPKKLPLTTTKRGIDAASNVYSEVKELMREATKALTTFTNRWKRFPQKLESLYQNSAYVELSELEAMSTSLPMLQTRKFASIKKHEPKYPEPEQDKTSAVVKFAALKTDLKILAQHYFDDPSIKPGAVGEAAFNDALQQVKQKIEEGA